MGWKNLFHCEIQQFPRQVLDYWFPNSESYEDITKTTFTKWKGKVDVLTGGFPCQPFSYAGSRKGAEDDRYLWPEMLRAIREIQPTWVVAENVVGITTMVQPSSVTEMGRSDFLFEESVVCREEYRYILDAICEDIEREGYEVQPLVIPACATGAPHRRNRIWIVAHRTDTLLSRSKQGSKEMFLGFMELAEKHLADPNSPLRNEECYIPFLEYAIKEGKIDEAYKERYSFQLRNALKNRVGTIANDFKYITREGTTGTLKSIKANYTLIYFNNPDCHDCKRVYNILAGDSPTLAHLVARGELAILALYPDESLTSWNKNKGIYPYNWIVARYARDIDRERYNIPAIPSTYLLDKNKKVIYKDAIIEAVESYLRHKYKL